MKGNNTMTREDFVKGISHPRKVELANMLFDGASVEEMTNAGFGRINVLEMARDISRDVEGQEDFSVDYPNEVESDGEKKESSTAAESATASSASETGNENNDGDPKSSVDGKVETLGGNPVGSTTGEEDEAKKAEIAAEEKKDDENSFGHGGAHETETIGGNPQTVTTGEEDAEALKRNEDANDNQ